MEKIKINETPVRTSRNFGINNIELDNINMPNNFGYFSNVDINIESAKDKVSFDNSEYKKLTYGLGEELENQIKEKCNCPLKIDVSSILNKEINIDFDFNQSNRNLAENIQITATEKTKSTVILAYRSDDDASYYHNGIIRVLANKNTEVNVVIVNFLGSRATNFLSIENELKDNSKVTYTIIDFGGKVSITIKVRNAKRTYEVDGIENAICIHTMVLNTSHVTYILTEDGKVYKIDDNLPTVEKTDGYKGEAKDLGLINVVKIAVDKKLKFKLNDKLDQIVPCVYIVSDDGRMFTDEKFKEGASIVELVENKKEVKKENASQSN